MKSRAINSSARIIEFLFGGGVVRATITTGDAVRARGALIPARQRWVFVYFGPCVLAVASESSSIDPGERLGRRRVRVVATATGRSGQLCLHWPCMFCRLGGRPLLDANCPFATTIISNVESRWTRPGWTGRAQSNGRGPILDWRVGI